MDSLASMGFLPFITGGVTKIIIDEGEHFLVPNALRRYIDSGRDIAKLGKGFDSHADLVKYLGSAGDGHSWHHIVQSHPSNAAKFGNEAVHNTANVIALPNDLHREVTRFQNSIQQEITGSKTLKVWEWIARQDYKKQHLFGQELLEKIITGEWVP